MAEFIMTEVQYGHVIQTRYYMKDGLITPETRGYTQSSEGIAIDGFDGLYKQSSIGNAKTDTKVPYLSSDDLIKEQEKQDAIQAKREKEKQAYIAELEKNKLSVRKSRYEELIKLGVNSITASALTGHTPEIEQVKK